MQLQTDDISPPVRMMQFLFGAFVAKSLLVVAELGVAEQLGDGARTAAELGQALGLDADRLHRLLRALASYGIFQEQQDGRFANTALSSTLRSDLPGSMKAMALFLCGGPQWAAWGELGHSVRSGSSAFEKIHGCHPFEYMGKDVDFARVFHDAMTSLTEQDLAAIHAQYDFSSFDSLVDVAGGHGSLLVSCLQKNPKQRGVLFDRPEVVARAQPLLEAAGVIDRCQIVGGSFFEAVPPGASVYVLKYILHDWSDQEATAILKNIRRAAAPGSKLLVIDPIVKPPNVPDLAKVMDLQMMVFYGSGRERTQEEFAELLSAAGFRLTRVIPTFSPLSIIEAEPE
jgi:hypothetical protein